MLQTLNVARRKGVTVILGSGDGQTLRDEFHWKETQSLMRHSCQQGCTPWPTVSGATKNLPLPQHNYCHIQKGFENDNVFCLTAHFASALVLSPHAVHRASGIGHQQEFFMLGNNPVDL